MKQILCRVLLLIIIVAAILGLSSCKIIFGQELSTYELDSGRFDRTVVYKSELDLSDLVINVTTGSSIKQIAVTKDMVVSGDTNSVGTHDLVIEHGGERWTISYEVVYQIKFIVDGEIYDSQYAFTSDDIVVPDDPKKPGTTFLGWSQKVPHELSNNMEFVAVFTDSIQIPKFNAVYGDTLATLELPQISGGKWQWDLPLTTSVGDAGNNQFDLWYIPDASAIDPMVFSVNVKVERKKIDILVDESTLKFQYDGKEHLPSYSLPSDITEVTTDDIWVFCEPKTEIGKYNFKLRITHDNYEGEYEGTFEITKIPIIISVLLKDNNDGAYKKSVWIKYGEQMPDCIYKVTDANGNEIEFIDPSIKVNLNKPSMLQAGDHYISATLYDADADDGIDFTSYYEVLKDEEASLPAHLHVQALELSLEDVGVPQLLAPDSIFYGDALSSVKFVEHQIGYWKWNLDGIEDNVGEAGPAEFTATFIPNDSSYNTLETTVSFTVQKKILTIYSEDKRVTYNGQEHFLDYYIKDDATGQYMLGLNVVITVDGEEGKKCINANAEGYTVTLKLDEKNYYAQRTQILIIDKAYPSEVDFTQIVRAVWKSGLKLGDIALPEGYAWEKPEYPENGFDIAGTYTDYIVVYTPTDTENYRIVSNKIRLEISKAEYTYEVESKYNVTYNGTDILLAGLIKLLDTNNNPVPLQFKDESGNVITSVKESGTYKVNVVIKGTDQYEEKVIATDVVVNKATPNISAPSIVGWTYGKYNATVNSPTGSSSNNYGTVAGYKYYTKNEDGKYVIYGTDGKTAPVNAGTYYVVAYVEEGTNHTYGESAFREFTISKAEIPVNIVIDPLAYTGDRLYPVVPESDYYTIAEEGSSDNLGGISAGEYSIVLTLVDSDNYKWASDATNSRTTLELKYNIIAATITINPLETGKSFVYGNDVVFTTTKDKEFGEIKYLYAPFANPNNYTETVPVNVGAYYVKAVVEADTVNGNWNAASTAPVLFNITKATVTVPTLNSTTFVYTSGLITPVVIDNDEANKALYSVTNDGATNVGSYSVTLTLLDSDNYKWSDVSGKDRVLSYTITAATPNVTAPSIDGWEFSVDPQSPTGSTTDFGSVIYQFRADGSETWITWDENNSPVNAGKYYVRAYVAKDSSEYVNWIAAASSEVELVIEQFSVNIPEFVKDSFEYTGNPISPTLKESSSYYTPVNQSVLTKINCGEYLVEYKLINGNYKWSDGSVTNKTIKYTITQATVSVNSVEFKANGQLLESYQWVYKTTVTLTPKTNKTFSGTNFTYTYEFYKHNGTEYELMENVTKFADVKNAGKYMVKISVVSDLSSYKNYVGGETYTEEFTIGKATYNMSDAHWVVPSVENLVYNGSEKKVTVTGLPTGVTVESYEGNTAKNAGNYTAKVNFSYDSANYFAPELEDCEWSISKKQIQAPTLGDNEFEFNRNPQTYIPYGFDSNYMTISGNVQTNANGYTAVVELKDTDNHEWKDAEAGEEITSRSFAYTITTKSIADAVAVADKTLEFISLTNKQTQTFTVTLGNVVLTADDYTVTIKDESGNTVLPNEIITAGDYTVTVSGKGNYHGEAASIEFTVSKKPIPVPDVGSVEYTGEGVCGSFEKNDSLYSYVITRGTNVSDNPYVTFTFTEAAFANHKWEDTDDDSVEIDAVQGSAKVYYDITPTIPVISATSGSKDYDKSAISFTFTVKAGITEIKNTDTTKYISVHYYDEDGKELDSIPSDVGTYTIKVVVRAGDNWVSTDDEYTYTINPAKVSAPYLADTNKSRPYSTSGFMPSLENLIDDEYYSVTYKNPDGEKITNIIQSKDAGTYTITVTLNDTKNYVWSTTKKSDALTFTYSIIKNEENEVETPDISNKPFDGQPANPSSSSDFGTPYYEYYKLGDDGEYHLVVDESGKPVTSVSDAGSYKVIAKVDGDDKNYDGGNSEPEYFTISKAEEIPKISATTGTNFDSTTNTVNLSYTPSTTFDITKLINVSLDTDNVYKSNRTPKISIERYSPVQLFTVEEEPDYVELSGAGWYKVTYVYDSDPNYVNKTVVVLVYIAPQSISGATVNLAMKNGDAGLIYTGEALGQSVTSVTVKIGNRTVVVPAGDYEVSFKKGDDTVVKNAGTYTVTVTINNEESNFTGTATTTFDVAPRTITAPTFTGSEFVYDGYSHKPTASNEVDKKYYEYVNNGNTNIGSYDITVSIKNEHVGNVVWSASSKTEFSYTIKPRDISTADVILSMQNGDPGLVYTGSDIHQSISSITIDGVTGEITYNVTGLTGQDAGEYTVTLTGTGNFTGTKTVKFTIAPKPTSITASDETETYTGSHFDPADLIKAYFTDVDGNRSSSGIKYYITVYEGGKYVEKEVTDQIKNVLDGGYTITVKLENSNYTAESKPVKVTINKRDISDADITLGDALTYDGSEQSQTVTSVKIGNLVVTYEVTGNTGKNADTYTMTVTGTGNFTGAKNVDFTISPKPTSITVGDKTDTYKGSHFDPATLIGATFIDVYGNASSSGIKYYIMVDGVETEVTDQIKDVLDGGYTVIVKLENSNYTADEETVTVTISPKDISDAEVVLGEAPIYGGVGVEKTQTITSVKIDGLNITYGVTGNTGENAGPYTMTITGTGNFTGTKTVDWSILKAEASITTDEIGNKEYNGEAGYNLADLINASAKNDKGETVSGTFEYYLVDEYGNETGAPESLVNLGTYKVKVVLKHNDYEKDTTVTIKIVEKDISNAVVILGETPIYGGVGVNKTQTITSVTVDGLVVTYRVTGNTGEGAGPYTMTIVGTGNFTGTKTVDWSINKAPATVVTDVDNSKEYKGADGYTLAELINPSAKNDNGEIISGAFKYYLVDENGNETETTANLVNADTYKIKVVLDHKNYENAEEVIVTVTINPMKVSEPTFIGMNDTYKSYFTYDSSEKTVLPIHLSGFNPDYMTIDSGNTETNAGTGHVLVIKLTDTNHTWNSGSDGNVVWSIEKQTINIPDNFAVEFTGADIEDIKLTLGDVEGTVYTVTYETSKNYLKDVGDYVATLSFGENSNNFKWENGSSDDVEVKYSIALKLVTWNDVSYPNSWKYGENHTKNEFTANPVHIVGGVENTFGYITEFKVKGADDSTYSEDFASVISAGAVTYVVRFTAEVPESEKDTYAANSLSITREFTIEKASVTLSTADGSVINKDSNGNSLVYTGPDFSLIVADLIGTTYTDAITGSATSEGITYSVEEITSAGDHSVTITLDRDNYDTVSVTVTVHVDKATIKVESVTLGGWDYDPDHEIKPESTISDSYGDLEVEYSYTYYKYNSGTGKYELMPEGEYPSDVGDYMVVARVVDDEDNNYVGSDEEEYTASTTFSIDPADSELSVTEKDGVTKVTDPVTGNVIKYQIGYISGGYTLADIFTVTASGGSYSIKVNGQNVENAETVCFTSATTYTVYLELTDSNYESKSLTVTVQIMSVSANFSVTEKDGVTVVTDPETGEVTSYQIGYISGGYTITDLFTVGGNCEYDTEISGQGTSLNSVGTYTVVLSPKDSNYTGDLTITVEITKATAYIFATDPDAKEYTGGSFDPETLIGATANTAANGEGTDLTDYIKYYIMVNGVETEVTYETGHIKDANENGYEIIIKLVNDNYVASAETVTVIINKSTDTGTIAETGNATYNDPLPVLPTEYNSFGSWGWYMDEEGTTPATTVGNATAGATNTRYAIFTPTNENYAKRVIPVAFTVAKGTIDMTGVQWGYVTEDGEERNYPVDENDPSNHGFTYTGDSWTVVLIGLPEGITVTGYSNNSGTMPGVYPATVELSYDSDNYELKNIPEGIYSHDWQIKKIVATVDVAVEEGLNLEYNGKAMTYDELMSYITVTLGEGTDIETPVYEYYLVTVGEDGKEVETKITTSMASLNIKNAGLYTIRVKLVHDYYYGIKDVNLQIKPKSVSISFGDGNSLEKGEDGKPVKGTDNKYTLNLIYKGAAFTEEDLKNLIKASVSGAIEGETLEIAYTCLTEIKNVNEYNVTVAIDSNDNYAIDGGNITVKVVVSKATIQIESTPVFSGTTYYENIFNTGDYAPTVPGVIKVTTGGLKGEAVEIGTWKYSATFNSTNPAASTYVARFDLGDNFKNYQLAGGKSSVDITNAIVDGEDTGKKMSISLVIVARVGSAYGSGTAYGTIENAVAAAASGTTKTVWVSADKTHNIIMKGVWNSSTFSYSKEFTIPSGVTVILPHDTSGGRNSGGVSTDIVSSAPTAGNGATVVRIDSGVTVIVNGTLEISGVLNGGTTSSNFNGNTTSKYAELILGDGAVLKSEGCGNDKKTVVDNGIWCAGYITGAETSKVVIDEGGKIYQPFILRDFEGGAFFSHYYMGHYTDNTTLPPFKEFHFANVQTELTIYYGGRMYAWANLYANKQHHHTDAPYIGYTGATDSDGNAETHFMNISQDGYMTAKYDPNTQVTKVVFDGGATMNSLNLSLAGNQVSTARVYFSLSWLYDITLRNGTYNALTATDKDGTYNINLKLMWGSKMTIEEDATLNVSTLAIYDKAAWTTYKNARDNNDRTNSTHLYADGKTENQGVDAQLIVKGTLNVANLGGAVYKEENAKVSITGSETCTSKEVVGFKYGTVFGLGYAEDFNIVDLTFGAVIYTKTNGVWTPSIDSITVEYNSNGGTVINPTIVNKTDGVFSIPVPATNPAKTGYTFLGWYTDPEFQNAYTAGMTLGEADLSSGNVTLYAKWVKNTITISYNTDGGTAASKPNLTGQNLAGSTDKFTYTVKLPNATKNGYVFLGWYNGNERIGGSGDTYTFTTSDLNHGTVSIYANFIPITYTITIKYRDTAGNAIAGADDVVITFVYTDAAIVLTKLDTDYSFVGWFKNSEMTTSLTDQTYYTPSDLISYLGLTPTATTKTEATVYAKYSSVGIKIYYDNSMSSTDDGKGSDYSGLIPSEPLAFSPDDLASATVSNLKSIEANKYKSNAAYQYYFSKFVCTVGDTEYVGLDEILAAIKADAKDTTTDKEYTITAVWTKKCTVTVAFSGKANKVVISSSDGNKTVNSSDSSKIAYYPAGAKLTITVSGGSESNSVSNFTNATKNSDGTYTVNADGTLTVTGSNGSCVTGDTLVTLADGSQKRIDQITSSDILKVWNFFEGKYDYVPAAIIFDHGYGDNTVIELRFSDGTIVKVVNLHQFYNADLNKFVTIDENSVSDYVGDKFVKANGDGYTTVTLVDYAVSHEYIEAYGIISALHYNILVEGMLSTDFMPEDYDLFNYFEFDDNVMFDEEKMNEDIAKYGLYTYEEFADYLTYEQFVGFNVQYFKIAVGKGNYTYEGIIDLIKEYLYQ